MTVIIDQFPSLVRRHRYGRELLSAAVCIALLIIGLPILCEVGAENTLLSSPNGLL